MLCPVGGRVFFVLFFYPLLFFPEGLAPADSLNDPATESNGHELTLSAVTSAVARLASTFGPAAKIQTLAPHCELTNGVATTAQVRDNSRRSQCE